ncbi:MAG: hypothetical protein JXR81_01080 [Candidatus Goldbacteria bacterium]|nr:hypothetical protein [Candidatus Goldiibacteriota bacterium]
MSTKIKKKMDFAVAILSVSCLFALAGLLLLYNAYHKKIAVTCAVNQLEFTGTLPSIITSGDKLIAPILQDDPMFKRYKVTGHLKCDFYEDYISLRSVAINLTSGGASVKLSEIIDARTRK